MATSKKAQEAQVKEEARQATLDDLLSKRPLSRTVTVYSGDQPLTVTVQSIGRKAYADLAERHTRTRKVPEVDDEGNEVKHSNGKAKMTEEEYLDEEEFLIELVSASAKDPEIPLDAVREISDTWNATEFDTLAVAAFEVNTQNKISRQGKG